MVMSNHTKEITIPQLTVPQNIALALCNYFGELSENGHLPLETQRQALLHHMRIYSRLDEQFKQLVQHAAELRSPWEKFKDGQE